MRPCCCHQPVAPAERRQHRAGERISGRNACGRSVPSSRRRPGGSGKRHPGKSLPRPQIPEFPEFLSVRSSGLKTERHRLHRLPPRSEPTAEDVPGVYSTAFNFQTRGLALLQSLQHFHPHGPSPSRSTAFVCPSLRPLKARPIPQCRGFTLLRNN